MIKRIKNFKKSLKERKSKTLIYILGLLLIVNIVSAIYFIYSLSLLSNIETFIRYIVILLDILLIFVFINSLMKCVIKNKIKKYIIFIFTILIAINIQFVGGYLINKIYNPIKNINKQSITYSESLIVLNNNKISSVNDIKNKTIGIISEEKSYEDYTIGNEIIKSNKLNSNKIKEYDDYFEMLNDLYDKKIDAALVSSNYKIMFASSGEKFQNIENDVKELFKKSKQFEKENTTSINMNNKDLIKEPFTILLMGVDSETDGLDKDAAFNGDSLMLITFNPNTLNTTVLSIPRDTYVPIMCFKNKKENKITHAAWYGVDCMESTIENFTGIDIDYYVKMNFKGVVNLIDAIGGIDVNVPFEFCEQNSDRQWGNSEICLKTGEQHLDGEQSLALARHRKTLALGDIQRGLNQQLVIEGMLKKISNIDSLTKLNNILNTISNNMDTNISTNQILSFYNIGKDILIKSVHTTTEDLISMEKLYLDGYTKMIYDEGFGFNLSNYVYYKSSLKKVAEAMKINLEIQKPTMIKEFSWNVNENYEKQTIGQGEKDSESTITTLPSFIGKTKSYVSNWGNANNVSISFNEIEKGDSKYKESYSDGQIINQSVPQGYEIKKIKSITFDVIVKSKEIKEEQNTSDELNCEKDSTNSKCLLPNMNGWTLEKFNNWYSGIPVSIIVEKIELDVGDPRYDIEKSGTIVETNKKSGDKLVDIAKLIYYYMPVVENNNISDNTDGDVSNEEDNNISNNEDNNVDENTNNG